ncbi:DUF4376 domain-containing protein [Pseudomonas sp. stari2]|uniref:DUF4376 domain-containing protein n=1 Tax=Pseudomonas sp. Stari2 TaxID=2954814 RepID=UPI00345DCAD3
MSIYVRIYGDQVFEQVETDGDIATMYHPSLTWVCVDGIDPPPQIHWQARKIKGGWRFTPPKLPDVTPEQLAEQVAAERFMREASGIVVEGLTIETSRDSQALIAGTGLAAIRNPDYRCNFKTATGFVEIGAEQIINIADAVRSHVQACFDRELELLRVIEAGEYRDEMLVQGWPDSSPPLDAAEPK